MDNPGMGSGNQNSIRDAAALKAFKNNENLDELTEEQTDTNKEKEEPKAEDFKPFKDPEKLKELKKENPDPTEDK